MGKKNSESVWVSREGLAGPDSPPLIKHNHMNPDIFSTTFGLKFVPRQKYASYSNSENVGFFVVKYDLSVKMFNCILKEENIADILFSPSLLFAVV